MNIIIIPMSKHNVVTLREFDVNKFVMDKNIKNNKIHIYYNKNPFILNAGNLECPHGIDYIHGNSYGLLTFAVEGRFTDVLKQLDDIALRIGVKRSIELFGEEITEKNKVPYFPLCKVSDDETEITTTLIIPYKNDMPYISVFDKTSNRLGDPTIYLSNNFIAKALIKFPSLQVDNGSLRWNVHLSQLKVVEYSLLPDGCILFDDETECLNELERRKNASDLPGFEITDEDDGVNELLDD